MSSKRKTTIRAQGAARSEPSFKLQSPRKPILVVLLEVLEGHDEEFSHCSCSSSSTVQTSLMLDCSKRFLLEESTTMKPSSTGMISRNRVRVKTTKIGNSFSTSTSTTDDFPKIRWIEDDDTSASRGMDLFNVKKNMGSGFSSQKQKVVGAGRSAGDKLNPLYLSGGASACVFGREDPSCCFGQRKKGNHQPEALARSKSMRSNLAYLADEQLASTLFALIP